jgi:predicted DNA-binding transcriptional regulator YafY
MNRIERLQSILIQLQSKQVVKAQEIADRFQISLRTVYRDMRALEESGVPIGAEAGIGYFLSDGFVLPPILFDSKEALSLLLAGKLVPFLSDQQTNESLQNALFKIKSVLKPHDKEAMGILETHMHVYNGLSQTPTPKSIYLHEVQSALIQNKVIRLSYFSNYNQQQTSREVEPIALIFYAMNWHLIGFCRMRQSYRDFRLDRIIDLQITDEKFTRDLKQSFNEFVESEKKRNNYIEINILVTKQLALLISDSKYWYGFIKEEALGEKIKMTFLNPDIAGFARWILTMGEAVDILSPHELKSKIIEMVQNLNTLYLPSHPLKEQH